MYYDEAHHGLINSEKQAKTAYIASPSEIPTMKPID